MKADQSICLSLQIPLSLRERVRVVAKRLRKTTADVVRDGLREKVDQLEAVIRTEENQFLAEKEAKRFARKTPGPLAPKDTSLAPRPFEVRMAEKAPEVDRVTEICTKHAPKVVDALKTPTGPRAAIDAAIAEIKREMPLTRPPDDFIITTLERIVVRLTKESELPPVVRVVDTSELQHHGDE